MNTIEIGSDYSVTLTGMQNSADGTYLNAGTATYALKDAAGDTVAGGTGSLAYVTASNGNYLGVIESTVTSTLTQGARYVIVITFAQGSIDRTLRYDLTAVLASEAIIDPATWQEATGQVITGANLTALRRCCSGVRAAILKMLQPYIPEPQSATFILDAPPTEALILPVRPIRLITSLYVHSGANGDATLFTADDLLVSGTDYYMPTDPLDGTNKTGIVYRRGSRTIWGFESKYYPFALASSFGSDRGAVKVVAEIGEAVVPDDVRVAAVSAVTLLYGRRKTGAPLQSENWNGYGYGLASAFTAEAAVRSPEVLGFLRPYLTPHFG